jgi:CBS-domain-containing membrane protein
MNDEDAGEMVVVASLFGLAKQKTAAMTAISTLMSREDTHHVIIVSGRRLVGVVSTMDITRWLARN